MTDQKARTLKPGDKVIFIGTLFRLVGTVRTVIQREVTALKVPQCEVTIEWADYNVARISSENMRLIERAS